MQEIIEVKGTRMRMFKHIIVVPKGDEREWTEAISDEIIADYLPEMIEGPY